MTQIIRNINAKLWILILIAFLIGVSAQSQDSTAGKTLSQKKFQRLLKKKNTVLLDVRTSDEYKAGHIPDAKQIDVLKKEDFKKQISTLDKNKKYFLYCRSGKRSNSAKILMKELGFNKLYDLKGGYKEWSGPNEIK